MPSDEYGGCFLAGQHFVLTGPQADLLLLPLPPVVHLRTEADKTAMRSSLARMREEVSESRPGGALVIHQLAYALLIQALRLEIAASLGYESESAFGKAFKRVMGCSPRHYKAQGSSVAQG